MSNERTTPLFSIVTACYNSGEAILDTIRSVQKQNIESSLVEHIFIDGASRDGTPERIRENVSYPYKLISEKDEGIYDAMNKGIASSQGQWICFLNSDDSFASDNVLQDFQNAIAANPSAELIYGKVANIQDGKLLNYRGRPITPDDYWYPVNCMCHQAVFFRRDLFERHGMFRLGIGGGIADYIWLVEYFHAPHGQTLFLDTLVSHFAEDGYSLVNIWDGYLAHLRFAEEFFPWNIRWRFYKMFPMKFLRFKVLQLHKDTAFRRLYRKIMRKLKHERKLHQSNL